MVTQTTPPAPPAQCWTADDQRALETLTKRRQEFMAANRIPVEKLARELHACQYPIQTAALLIENAGSIRDMLKPFDDGTRAMPANTTGEIP